MSVLAIILGALAVFGLWEYVAHMRNLRRVPLRIHVNGTRGKSSVTRLVAAGLRAGGIRTCAKTTGSRPRMILEDGSEYSIQRQGRANILEQIRAVAVAARRNADALVAECMALNPRYQLLCGRTMLRSRIGVITNVRADHLDEMGPTVIDVAKALVGTTPRKGILVTAESDASSLRILSRACQLDSAELAVTTPQSQGVTEAIMRGFSYIEHPENVAIALKVCQLAGVDAETAIEGMHAAEPDVGALRMLRLAFFAKRIDFINALAANDPDSTLSIWDRVLALYPGDFQRVALLNCRADRPQRSIQLGAILPRMESLNRTLLTGSGTRLALQASLDSGLHPERVIELENASPSQVFERALAQIGKVGQIFGMGNIGSGGSEIVEYFKNRAISPEEFAQGEERWKT